MIKLGLIFLAVSLLIDATEVTIEGLDVQMGSDGTDKDVSAQLSITF